MFGVSGKLKFILVSALFVALGVPLAGSRTIAAEHSAATPPVSASAKNTTEEAAVKESEGAASDPSIPEVKLTSRILFQLIASEIALQRGQAGAAYQTYLTLAEETGDPRIAERAAQIALASNAPNFRKQFPSGSSSRQTTQKLRKLLSRAALFPTNWIRSPVRQRVFWLSPKTKALKLLNSRPSWP